MEAPIPPTICCYVLGVLAVDLDNPTEPTWNVLLNSIRPTLSQQYGAKAAVLAIVGAGIVFVGLIPGRNNKLSKMIDLFVKIAGPVSVMVVGWFWLLGETDGRPGPYLVAFIPIVGTLVVAILVLFPFNFSHRPSQYNRVKPAKKQVRIGVHSRLASLRSFWGLPSSLRSSMFHVGSFKKDAYRTLQFLLPMTWWIMW